MALIGIAVFTFTPRHLGASEETFIQSILDRKPEVHKISADGAVATLRIWRHEDPNSPRHGVVLCSLEVDPKDFLPAVHSGGSLGRAEALYTELAEAVPGTVAIVNGGTWDGSLELTEWKTRTADGLVISDMKTRHDQAPWQTGGFLVVGPDHVEIQRADELHLGPDTTHVLQVNILLVWDAMVFKIKKKKRPFTNRAAIGLTSDGNVLVAGAFNRHGGALRLFEFADFLATPKEQGGPGARVAMNLDGAGASQLVIPHLRLHLGESGSVYSPNRILIVRRSEDDIAQ